MAAPHVTGVAALVLSAWPAYSPDQIEAALESTAVDLGIVGRDDLFGHGRLNAAAAVAFGAVPPGAPTGVTATPGNASALVDLDGPRLERRQPHQRLHRDQLARRPDLHHERALVHGVGPRQRHRLHVHRHRHQAAGTGPASAASAPVTPSAPVIAVPPTAAITALPTWLAATRCRFAGRPWPARPRSPPTTSATGERPGTAASARP